ncbi:MAG: C40 family peptidase [Candidatus Pelethousia sp.]|nr:C40 family peptidase [Candidatus Pelethousia sp.]
MQQIVSPYAPLYCKPCALAERVDEAWFGQTAEVLDEPEAGWLRVHMEYGYESYIEAAHLGPAIEGGEARTVRAPWADVLEAPRYQAGLHLTLPRGSRVRALAQEADWTRLALPEGREGYIRTCHLFTLLPEAAGREPALLRGQIADAAFGYLGCQYRWGGRTPAGLDGGGLCHAAYLLSGVAICRNARLDEGYPVREIPRSQLQIGDLLYFPGHIALYLGGGRYIHASGSVGRVALGSLRLGDLDYRVELAESLLYVGSIFPL